MSHNDITGDRIATRPATKSFRDGWERLFKPAPTCCDLNDPHGTCEQGRGCPLRATKQEKGRE